MGDNNRKHKRRH